jgi:hypothetical protein
LSDFISAAARNLTIDQTLTEGTLVSLAKEFHSFPPGALKAETLPTVGPYWPTPITEVLLPAAAADQAMIRKFLEFGTTKAAGSTGTTQATGTPSTPPDLQTTKVTTAGKAPAGEAPILNNQSQPYDVKAC